MHSKVHYAVSLVLNMLGFLASLAVLVGIGLESGNVAISRKILQRSILGSCVLCLLCILASTIQFAVGIITENHEFFINADKPWEEIFSDGGPGPG
jgi:hypothetical protein